MTSLDNWKMGAVLATMREQILTLAWLLTEEKNKTQRWMNGEDVDSDVAPEVPPADE